MNRLVLYMLVIAAVAQPLRNTGIYILYRANHSYIISHLCEQRQVPASGCEGKCYLKKQYKKEAQRRQQLPATLRLAAVDLMLMPEAFRLNRPHLPTARQERRAPLTLQVYISPLFGFFHPPEPLVSVRVTSCHQGVLNYC